MLYTLYSSGELLSSDERTTPKPTFETIFQQFATPILYGQWFFVDIYVSKYFWFSYLFEQTKKAVIGIIFVAIKTVFKSTLTK
jgi:hypothetical protein